MHGGGLARLRGAGDCVVEHGLAPFHALFPEGGEACARGGTGRWGGGGLLSLSCSDPLRLLPAPSHTPCWETTVLWTTSQHIQHIPVQHTRLIGLDKICPGSFDPQQPVASPCSPPKTKQIPYCCVCRAKPRSFTLPLCSQTDRSGRGCSPSAPSTPGPPSGEP